MPTNKTLEENIQLTKDSSKVLGLKVGKNTPTPGSFISKADAQSAPALSFANADLSKTYLAACLDLDAPFQTFAVLSPILHWIQPGFKRISESGASLESKAPLITDYAAPSPPAPSGPHRYVFLLYEQPSDFDASKFAPQDEKASLWSRVRFDWDGWVKRAGLTQPVAVNYFTSH